MPAGLRIEYADGGRPLEITAGMKGLKYVGSFWNGGPASLSLGELNPAFPTYMTPYESYRYIGSWVNGQIQYLTGYSVSGNTITQSFGGNNQSGGAFAASVWQIDQSSPRSGLFIANSSDFTSIGNNLALGLCVFRGWVTINGSWTPPIPAGATGVTVFVKFNNTGVTLLYTGGAITCWGNSDMDSNPASVDVKVVVFVAGIEPTPHRGGLNMWNAAGRCTFSSANRPFITYGGTIPLTVGDQSTGGGMVQLCSTGAGFHGRDHGDTGWTKGLGFTMGDGFARVGWANLIHKDTEWYGANRTDYYVPGITVPVIPDIYI